MELVSCQPPDDFLLPGVLSFNALMGLSCYTAECLKMGKEKVFQCPHGLELLLLLQMQRRLEMDCFNALMGLSCYLTN